MGLVSDFRKRTAGKSNDEINKYLYSRGELNSRYDDAERRETPKLVEAANKYIQTVNNSAANNQGFTAAILASKRVNEGNRLQQQLKGANMQHAANVVGRAKDAVAMPLDNRLRGSYTNGFTDAVYTNERIKQLRNEAGRQAAESVGEEYRVNPQGRIDQAAQMTARLKNDYRYKLAQTMFMTDRPSEQVLREFGSVKNAMEYIEQTEERIKAAEQEQSYANYYGGNELKYGGLKDAEGYDSAIRLSINSTPTMDKVLPRDAMANGVTSENTDLYALYINGDDQLKNTIERGYGLGARVTFLRYLTDEQKNNYNYIRATEGGKAAEQYIADIEPTLKRQQYAAEKAQAEAFAKSDPVGASIQSALLSPITGLDYVMQTADQAFGTGQDELGDARAATWTAGQQKRSLRNTVSGNIQNPWGQFFYGTGMSMADNLVNRLASGGNSGLAMVLMGSGAAAQTYYDALENGRTEEEALTQATAAGIIEGVTEKIGFDNLTDIIKAGKTSFKSAATQIAKQAITEGLEEGTSNIANLAYDMIAYGGDSDAARRVKEYVKNGMNEEEARRKVAGELAAEFGTDVAGGALSGLGFGAGGTFVGTTANADAVYTQNKGAQSRLVNAARLAGVKGSEKYAEKIRQGKTLTKGEYTNVYDAVDVVQQKQEAKREKGYTDDKEAQLALVEEGKELGSKHAAEYGKIIEGGKALTKKQYAQLAQENAELIQEQVDKTAKTTEEKTAEPIIIAEKTNAEQLKQLDAMAQTFGEAKNAFIKGYEATVNGKAVSVQDYTAAVNSAVKALSEGGKVSAGAYAALGTKGLNAARTIAVRRSAGDIMQQAETAAAKAQEALNKLRGENRASITPGKVTYLSEGAQNRTGAANAALFAAHSKAYGTNFVIHETLEKENGYYDPKTNTIHIAADSENPMAMVAAHELTHYIQKWSPEKYQKLVKLLKNYYGGKWNGLVDAKMQSYGAAGISLSINGAVDEVAADACEMFFGMDMDSEEFAGLIEAVANEDKTLARRVFDFLEEIYEVIKEVLASLNPRSREAQLLSENKKMLEKARALWTQALADASETSAAVSASEQNIQALKSEDTKHKLNPSFAAEYDAWDKVTANKQFEIGTTSKALQYIGVNQQKIYWSGANIIHAKKHPEMTDAVIKRVPEIIENPMIVMESKTVNDRLTVFGELFVSKNGKNIPVLAILELVKNKDGSANIDDYTIIVNAYGKDTNPQALINTSRILWVEPDNNKTQTWLTNTRLQLPVGVKSGLNGRISSVNNSISKTEGNSNRQFSLRDKAYLEAVNNNDMETAQKLVDEAAREAGFIQKAYHGTDSEDFYKFMWEETQRADAGWYGRGHYFATRKGEAEMYGKRVISAVLNLGKTFNFDKEMTTIDGYSGQNVSFKAVAFYINAAEKFPDLFKNRKISLYDYSTGERAIKWSEVHKEINEILDDPSFKTIQYADGRYRWTLGDWKKKAYYSNDYYDTKADADSAKYAAAVDFWVEKNNVQVPMSPEGYYLGGDMNASNAFTEELKKQGYNSVIQSENGDEIVVFNSNQIKSADPVTYDDNGNVIPLSERFTDSEDIRYSARGNGYDGYSMSNNARAAYASGEMPKSKWTKGAILEAVAEIDESKLGLIAGLPAATLKEHLLYKSSWHHTSSMYNKTDFYSIDETVLDKLTEKTVASWDTSKPEVQANTYRGDFEYIEWEGSRKHPKAINHKLTDVNIEERGKFYIVTDDSGNQLAKKMIGSNGTYATNYEQQQRVRQAIAEAEDERAQNSTASANALYDELRKAGRDISSSGNIYRAGRKPTPEVYERGIENFFEKGEQRLSPNDRGGYFVETWDGAKWVAEDVRYSVRRSAIDSGMQKESDRTGKKSAIMADEEIRELIKENEVFRKRIAKQDDIIKELKRQMKPTDALRNDRTEINRYARELKKTYGTDVDAKYIADTLDEMYTEMLSAAPDEAYIMQLGVGLAREMLENSRVLDENHEDVYKHIRKKLRETTFSLTDEQKAEIKAALGVSYGRFRQMMMGKLSMKNDAPSLDSYWEQFVNESNGLLDIYTNEGDQIMAMYELANEAQKQYITVYKDMGLTLEEAAVDLFTDMRAKQIELSLAKATFADEMLKRIEDANEQTKKAKQEMRDKVAEYKEKVKEAKQKEREKFAEYREKKAKEPVLKSIADKAKILKTLLEKPNERSGQYVPDALRASVVKVVTALDFTEVEGIRNAAKNIKALLKNENKKKGKTISESALATINELLEATEKSQLDVIKEKAEELTLLFADNQDDTSKALMSHLGSLLNQIDKYEKKNAKALADGIVTLANYFDHAEADALPMGINPYIVPAFIAMAKRLHENNNGKRLSDMSVEELKTIKDTLTSLRQAISTVNKLFKNERYKTAIEAAEATMHYAETRRHKFHDWKRLNSIKGFFNVGQMDAYTYFSMFGESGQSIIDELSNGQDKAHDRIREAAAWVQNMRGRLRLTHKDMNEWKKEKHTFKLESGESVTMTTREVMEFYLLTNRAQARQHILEGGFSLASATQRRIYNGITEGDIETITEALSEKQKKAADAMQRYLSTTVAEWGNETSRQAYGVRLFNEPKYWRIRTDGSSRDVEDQAQQIRSEALKYARQNAAINAGFSKHTNEYANNPLIVGDAFDSFDEHISGMATYNGLGLAIDDANKWLMFAHRDENGKKIPNEDVKTAIRSILGEVGVRYAENLLMDMNGLTPRVDESVLSKLMSNYKKSSVAAKIRVIIQQPTAMLRAASEINPAYMAVAAAKQVQPGLVKEMQKYSSIAWWKSNGNYDIGTGKSIHEILFGSDTAMRRLSSAAMLPAGKADDISWAVIWQACKEERAHENKVKIKDFTAVDFAIVAKRFSEVINKTQVVDTILHRSQNMRTKTVAMSQLTAFMSEPTKIFNMIRRSAVELANTEKGMQAKAAKRLLRTLLAWSASAVANAAVKSLWDAFRKREKDKEYSEQYQETFITNVLDEINVIRLIPIANNLWSIAEGYDQTSMPFDFAEKLKNGITQITKFDDENRSFTMYSAASNLANFFSAAFGLPLSGLISNFEGIWQAVTGENIKHKKSKTENYADMQKALESGNKSKYDKAYKAVYAQVAQDVEEAKAADPEKFAEENKGLSAEEVIQKKIDAGVRAAAKKKYYDPAIDAFEGGMDEYNKAVKDLEKYGITADDVKGWVGKEFKDEYVTGRDKDLEERLINAGYDEEDLFGWVTESYKNEAVERLESGDENALAEYAENLESEGIEPQNVWSRCRSIFKDEYTEAWRSGDRDRAEEIEKMLKGLGLKNKKGEAYADNDFFMGWRKAAEESGD